MMPLTMAAPGQTVTVRRITGRDGVRGHLAQLGFVENARVTVVSRMGAGLICQVKDSRIALDAALANRVMIG